VDSLADLRRLYDVLGELENRLGGKLKLRDCRGGPAWPRQGVYFFFEEGEQRRESGSGPRVVRVGTHALGENSKTTLWNRLAQHRGTSRSEGGNHRGSIFRLLVGTAIKQREGALEPRSWGVKGDPSGAARELGMSRSEVLDAERNLEGKVSRYIGDMPFLFVGVEDAAGPASARRIIERNAIALLSNYGRPALDPLSTGWLGRHCDRARVRESGLWNNNHVDETYDSEFLSALSYHMDRMSANASDRS
jgi:hypothetical protein